MELKITRIGREAACIFALFAILSFAAFAFQPSAPDNIINSTGSAPLASAGGMLNLSGGQINYLEINATTQNLHWIGYAGNITGKLALMDSSLNSMFTWDIEHIKGEIYATRNSSMPLWGSIKCANDSIIESEQGKLNITNTSVDSIENTFDAKVHDEFYAGVKNISSNQCYAAALNVNSTTQTSDFQEVLLTDGFSVIYASLLENSTRGFDNRSHDFQMILPQSALEGEQPNEAYYFYIELI